MSSALSTLKNYYKVLDLDLSCSCDEIKHSFRQKVALFHPDKVSHLDKQIQDLAVKRTVELTEAYSILANEAKRAAYDCMLQKTAEKSESADGPGSDVALSQSDAKPQNIGTEADPQSDENGRILVNSFLHKEALNRLRQAVQQQVSAAMEVKIEGFDVAYIIQPKWNLFRVQKRCARVMARVVARVDSVAVQDVWCAALPQTDYPPGDTYLFLVGASLDTASNISDAILEQKRRNRSKGRSILLAPLNANTWEALIPNSAPDLLRAIIKRIQESSR